MGMFVRPGARRGIEVHPDVRGVAAHPTSPVATNLHQADDAAVHDLYEMQVPDGSWTGLDWIPIQRMKPSSRHGPFVAATGKVMVWVLTQGAYSSGADPEACGFHLGLRTFDDDCPGGDDEVILWAPMAPAIPLHRTAAA